MTYYQILNTSDTRNIDTLMNYANTTSDYLFMPIILIVVFLIWVLGSTFMGKPISRSFLYASFLCALISVIFVILNWLSVNYMYFLFLMTAIGLVWVRLQESYS